jgi:hypothetical protein
MGVIETGILEQLYVTKEASYGTRVTTPASTDAVRALESMLTVHHQRPDSSEKRGTPEFYQALPARDISAWDISSGMWEPSGALGTASYWGPLLKGGLGAQHIIAGGLSTTIASGGSATGATLTSGTGLAVNDLIAVQVAGKLEITRLATVAGAVVTWDALTATPDTPGRVVAGITYSLASILTDSFGIAKFYNGAANQQAVTGAVVDHIDFTFDGTKPVMLGFKGPAAQHFRSGTTKPGAFTTAGSPLGGTVGQLIRGSASFLVHYAQITVSNNVQLRNVELGTAIGTGAFRTQNRKVEVKVAFYLDDVSLLTDADAITHNELRLILGSVNGKMLGAVLPNVEWEIPDIGKEPGPKIVTATADAYATAGNDSLYFAEL